MRLPQGKHAPVLYRVRNKKILEIILLKQTETTVKIKTYNKKAFLLPDSINSCALFHAKVFPDGKYIFRIHDCITGIRLSGDLNTPENIQEAKIKTRALIEGLKEFENFLNENYK